MKRGIIDFRTVPEKLEKDFLIPCTKVFGGVQINNNFIAASKDSEFLPLIREKLIANAERIETFPLYQDPRYWVHNLYGPTPVHEVIVKKVLGSAQQVDRMTDDEYFAACKNLADNIGVQNTDLFKNNRIHIHAAGDVSWATNSQEKKSGEILDAGKKIADFWKKKKPTHATAHICSVLKVTPAAIVPEVGAAKPFVSKPSTESERLELLVKQGAFRWKTIRESNGVGEDIDAVMHLDPFLEKHKKNISDEAIIGAFQLASDPSRGSYCPPIIASLENELKARGLLQEENKSEQKETARLRPGMG